MFRSKTWALDWWKRINSHSLNEKYPLWAAPKKDSSIIDPGTFQNCIRKRPITRPETDFYPNILRYYLCHLLLQLCLFTFRLKYILSSKYILSFCRSSVLFSFRLKGSLSLTSILLGYCSLLRQSLPLQSTLHSQSTDLQIFLSVVSSTGYNHSILNENEIPLWICSSYQADIKFSLFSYTHSADKATSLLLWTTLR